MTPSFGILAVINCMGLSQAAILGIALACRRRASQSDRLLGLLCLSIAAFIMGAVLLSTKLVLRVPHLSFTHDPIEFTCAPLLYLYIRSTQPNAPALRWKDLFHFLPAIVCFCILIPWYLLSSAEKLPVLEQAYQNGLPWFAKRTAAVLVQALAYLGLILFSTAWRRDVFTGHRSRILVWLMITAFTLGVMRALSFYNVLQALHLKENLLIPLFASAVMSYFTLRALRQAPPEAGFDLPSSQSLIKAVRTPASEELRQRLLGVMEKQQAFRDPRLNLHQLAELTGMPARNLSELINREFGQNVTDFVNHYRIQEAKRLLLDPRYSNSTLVALSEDVGFGSKSSFNLTFKKQTSMTPSEFRSSETS